MASAEQIQQAIEGTWVPIEVGYNGIFAFPDLLDRYGILISHVADVPSGLGAAGEFLAYQPEQGLGRECAASRAGQEPGTVEVLGNVYDQPVYISFAANQFGRNPVDAAMRYSPAIAQEVYRNVFTQSEWLAQRLLVAGWQVAMVGGNYKVYYTNGEVFVSSMLLPEKEAMLFMGLCYCVFALNAFQGLVQ